MRETNEMGPMAASGPSTGGGSSSSTPWGKIALGCGCLGLVGVVAAVVFGYFAFSSASNFLEEKKEEYGIGDVEITELGDEEKRERVKEKVEESAKEKVDTSLDPKELRNQLEKPLTRRDVKEYTGLVEDLRNDPAYREWKEEFAKLKKLGEKKDKGTLDSIKTARGLGKGMQAQREVYERYAELVEEQGGSRAYLGRLVRVSGAVAAAKQIASDHKLKDPASDTVAKKILEDRPEIRKEFLKNEREAREMMKATQKGKKPDDPAAITAMMMMVQKPGTIALARMPEKSFETWKSLPEKTRRKLLDLQSLKQKDFPALMLGVTVRGEPLIMTAEMQRFNDLKKKK